MPDVVSVEDVHSWALDATVRLLQEHVAPTPDDHDQSEQDDPRHECARAAAEPCPVEEVPKGNSSDYLGDPVQEVIECPRPHGEVVGVDICIPISPKQQKENALIFTYH